MKTKECPNCRALLVQASTVCASCGTQVGGSLPPAAVPVPPWLAELADSPDAPSPAADGSPAPTPDGAGWGAPAAGHATSPVDLPPIPNDPPPPPGSWGAGAVGDPPPRSADAPFGSAPAPPTYGAPGYGGPGYGAPASGAPAYGTPAYGAPGYPPPVVRSTHPQANTALVLGILALVVCGIFTAIPAIVIGNRVRREVQASRGALDGESTARTGVILGWISVAFTAVGVVAFVALMALGAAVETETRFEPVEVPDLQYEEPVPFDEFDQFEQPDSRRQSREDELIPTPTTR